MTQKAFKPTMAQRRRVRIAAGAGMAHNAICLGLAISRNTLLKYFSDELDRGSFQCRTDVLVAMYRAALKGSGSAARIYLANAPEFARQPAKQSPLGKKKQADVDAKSASTGTDWDDLIGPGKPN